MRLDKRQMIEYIEDLRNAYSSVQADYGRFGEYAKKKDILEKVVEKPAKQFYVSYEEAFRIINRINKYGTTGQSNKLNALKYNDLYRAYQIILSKNPGIPTKIIIQNSILSPAPRFYIRPLTAGMLLNKYITY